MSEFPLSEPLHAGVRTKGPNNGKLMRRKRMIKLHRVSFASSISTLTLLGWLAFDQASTAYADASTSSGYVDDAINLQLMSSAQLRRGNIETTRATLERLIELKGWPQPFMEQDEALELLEALKSF